MAAEFQSWFQIEKNPVSVWSTWFGGSGSRISFKRSFEPQLSPNPMKRSHNIGLQVFLLLFFYLNREPHLVLSFSKVSEPHSLWRRGDLLETQRVSLWMTSRKITEEARLLVPTCRPPTVGQALMAEGHSAPSLASNQRTGEKASILPHHPIPPIPAPPFSVSVVQQRYCLHSHFRHTISLPLPSY